MNRPRVLVAAKRVDPDASSEGICTAKFLKALTDDDLAMTVLTGDEATDQAGVRRALPWLTPPAEYRRTLPRRPATDRRLAHRAWTAVDLAGTVATGHPTWYRQSVRVWRRWIAEAVAAGAPDVIVTRGAGGGFEPHLAVLGLDPGIPWIAHYHDPWPASLMPEPYRAPRTRALARQEAEHRRILQRADALTFPSDRLRSWILADHPDLRAKAHVVPHAAGPPVGTSTADQALVAGALDRPFAVVHTGTLLRHRRIEPLVAALAAFVDGDPERRRDTCLVLAGTVVGAHAGDTSPPALAALERDGIVRRYPQRVGHATALALVDGACAAIVIEAAGPESPFFPSKLTDYAASGRPVLALTPRESVASDLMGAQHQLRVDPDDVGGITRALDTLWDARARGDLGRLGLPAAATEPLTPARVAAAFRAVLDEVTAGRTVAR